MFAVRLTNDVGHHWEGPFTLSEKACERAQGYSRMMADDGGSGEVFEGVPGGNGAPVACYRAGRPAALGETPVMLPSLTSFVAPEAGHGTAARPKRYARP